VDQWLLGDGCSTGDRKCSWKHCTNQCLGIINFNEHTINENLKAEFVAAASTEAKPEILRFKLGTTVAQDVGKL